MACMPPNRTMRLPRLAVLGDVAFDASCVVAVDSMDSYDSDKGRRTRIQMDRDGVMYTAFTDTSVEEVLDAISNVVASQGSDS